MLAKTDNSGVCGVRGEDGVQNVWLAGSSSDVVTSVVCQRDLFIFYTFVRLDRESDVTGFKCIPALHCSKTFKEK